MRIFRPDNWVCFFKFHVAAHSTQYSERTNWLCFFKSVWQYAQANRYMALTATLHCDIANLSTRSFVCSMNKLAHSTPLRINFQLALFFRRPKAYKFSYLPFIKGFMCQFAAGKLALFFQVPCRGTQHAVHGTNKLDLFFQRATNALRHKGIINRKSLMTKAAKKHKRRRKIDNLCHRYRQSIIKNTKIFLIS